MDQLTEREMALPSPYVMCCEACGARASVWERERVRCLACKQLGDYDDRNQLAERLVGQVFGTGEMPL